MTAYAYHLSLMTGQEQIKGRFEVVVKNKMPKLQISDMTRTPHHFGQLYRTVEQVLRCINDVVWFPSPGMFCPGCEYADECTVW